MNTVAKVGLWTIALSTLLGFIGLATFLIGLSSVGIISDTPQTGLNGSLSQGMGEMTFSFVFGLIGTIVLVVGLVTNKPRVKE